MSLHSASPILMPLGDRALLVRFGTQLDEAVNARAIAVAAQIADAGIVGVLEVMPNLVSVMVRYDPRQVSMNTLAGEIALYAWLGDQAPDIEAVTPRDVHVRFGGAEGPDLDEVASLLALDGRGFVERHCESPLRVLSGGFAPGFLYCGMHAQDLRLPRRTTVRPLVPAGSILFAAGLTAITSTSIPTGWHVIGRTDFSNFDPDADPPTQIGAGQYIRFVPVGS